MAGRPLVLGGYWIGGCLSRCWLAGCPWSQWGRWQWPCESHREQQWVCGPCPQEAQRRNVMCYLQSRKHGEEKEAQCLSISCTLMEHFLFFPLNWCFYLPVWSFPERLRNLCWVTKLEWSETNRMWNIPHHCVTPPSSSDKSCAETIQWLKRWFLQRIKFHFGLNKLGFWSFPKNTCSVLPQLVWPADCSF